MNQLLSWLQNFREKRKIKEQQELIQALKRPEDQKRRPAAKFVKKISRTGLE